MGFTKQQALDMIARCDANRLRGCAAKPQPDLIAPDGQAAEREVGRGGLQEQCDKYAAAQWPPWVSYGPRSDKKSTLPLGAPDRIYFLPGGRVLVCEFKAKDGKRTSDQQIFAKRLEMVGTVSQDVRSLEQFVALARKEIDRDLKTENTTP